MILLLIYTLLMQITKIQETTFYIKRAQHPRHIQPYSFPHPSLEKKKKKNRRNTRISHATLPRVKDSLERLGTSSPVSVFSCPFLSARSRGISLVHGEKRAADRQRGCRWRDNSRFVTSHSAASSRDTLDIVESWAKSETGPLLAPFVSVEAAAATANGSLRVEQTNRGKMSEPFLAYEPQLYPRHRCKRIFVILRVIGRYIVAKDSPRCNWVGWRFLLLNFITYFNKE